MAKQRPTLNVSAQPTSTFVDVGNVSAAGVELYDQQTVNLALQFANAFKDLSLTAANLAGTLKKESNEEELNKGMALVNQSQKSYKQLVETGQIKPTENPWMAIGAQKASGTVEGMKARAHFMSLYNKRVDEDPAFLEDGAGFSALASQYTQNVNTMIGNAPYMSQSFYESFNPFIASMGLEHENNVRKYREEKVQVGVSAATVQAVQDYRSADPTTRQNAILGLQEYIDGLGRNGYNQSNINKYTAKALIDAMATSDDPEVAETLLRSLKAGTGSLADTETAKIMLANKMPEITARRDRLTIEESKAFEKFKDQTISGVLSGFTSKDDAIKQIDSFLAGPERKITVTASEMESKRGYFIASLDKAQREAQRAAEQRTEDHIISTIDVFSTSVGPDEADLSDAQLMAKKGDALKTMMINLGVSPKDQMQYESMLVSKFNREAEQRSILRHEAQTTMLWNGTEQAPGLLPKAAEKFAMFLSPQFQDGVSEVPPIIEFKREIDRSLEASGITPNTDKAKAVYGQSASKFFNVVSSMEQQLGKNMNGGTLAAVANDTPETRATKSMLRGRIAALNMYIGSVFDDDRETQRRLQMFTRGFNTASVETGSNQDFEDTLQAYMFVKRNNLPMDTFIPNPQSENGKAMMSMMDWAASQYASGVQITDIARDMVQFKTMPVGIGMKPFELDKPLGWVEFNTGSGKDAEAMYLNMNDFRERNGVTEADAAIYASTVLANETFSKLSTTRVGNMKGAMRDAAAEVLNKHFIVRGSMIPRQGLAKFVDESYIEAWLDTKGYPDGTTLVPVLRNNDGTAMLAPRLNGRAVSNDLIRSTDLNTSSEKIIKKMPEIMRKKSEKEKSSFRKAAEMSDIGTLGL